MRTALVRWGPGAHAIVVPGHHIATVAHHRRHGTSSRDAAVLLHNGCHAGMRNMTNGTTQDLTILHQLGATAMDRTIATPRARLDAASRLISATGRRRTCLSTQKRRQAHSTLRVMTHMAEVRQCQGNVKHSLSTGYVLSLASRLLLDPCN